MELEPPEYIAEEIKHISHVRETKNLQSGDLVEYLGHVVQWDADCVSESTCQQWRRIGDPVCDAALDLVFPKGTSTAVGKDLLESLERFASENTSPNAVSLFLDEVHQLPPETLRVSDKEVEIAHAFFLDHAIQIMQSLLHYSLAGGFASARIVRTLQAVSYLVPPRQQNTTTTSTWEPIKPSASDDRTHSRLLETSQFVLDVMGCNANGEFDKDYLMPGHEGWKSAVRVRLLHGIARRRAREKVAKSRYVGDGDYQDVPISQEDMSATLASFSTVPIWSLNRMNLPPSTQQAHAFLSLWRHIGFYLGVSPTILNRYLSNPKTADKFLASITINLFSFDSLLELDSIPTIPILRAVSNRSPGNTSLAYNFAVTRYLLGPKLADHLGIPPTLWFMRTKLQMMLLVQKLPVWFGMYYPREAWVNKRRWTMSAGLPRVIRRILGMRRVLFRPRTDVCPTISTFNNEGGIGGALGEGVVEEESVQPDYIGGRLLEKRWKEVMMEMAGGYAILGIFLCGSLWAASQQFFNYFSVAYTQCGS